VVTWIGPPPRDDAVVEAADIRRKAASPTRDDNAFHLHVLREARSKSNSAVTKKKTSFELAPRDREFACHKPDLLS
jgi:hypothetical protein